MDDTEEIKGDKHVFECMNFNSSAKDVNKMNDNVIQRAEYWDGNI